MCIRCAQHCRHYISMHHTCAIAMGQGSNGNDSLFYLTPSNEAHPSALPVPQMTELDMNTCNRHMIVSSSHSIGLYKFPSYRCFEVFLPRDTIGTAEPSFLFLNPSNQEHLDGRYLSYMALYVFCLAQVGTQ